MTTLAKLTELATEVGLSIQFNDAPDECEWYDAPEAYEVAIPILLSALEQGRDDVADAVLSLVQIADILYQFYADDDEKEFAQVLDRANLTECSYMRDTIAHGWLNIPDQKARFFQLIDAREDKLTLQALPQAQAEAKQTSKRL